jgi:hypothetical protein
VDQPVAKVIGFADDHSRKLVRHSDALSRLGRMRDDDDRRWFANTLCNSARKLRDVLPPTRPAHGFHESLREVLS